MVSLHSDELCSSRLPYKKDGLGVKKGFAYSYGVQPQKESP